MVRKSLQPRTFAAACLALAALVASVTIAPAQAGAQATRPAARVASPDGRDVAEVRPRALGGDAVYVSGARVWPKDSERSAFVSSPVRWSRSGEAFALLVREKMTTRLVVVVVRGDAAGQVLEWDVPATALPAKVVTWLDARRVAVGPREMEPRLVASWQATPVP